MEDQRYNGDEWNKQIVKLLTLFGWIHIGDYDMDVKGSDGEKMGIDAIMQFDTPLKSMSQLAVVESKRYATTSFNKTLLQEWIMRLDKKLLNLRNSSPFYDTFPTAQECTLTDTGIIAIWFHDTDEYKRFIPTFKDILSQITIPTRTRKAGFNKIWVLDNLRLMKLFALQTAIRELSHRDNFWFLYSPRFCEDRPTERQSTLTIEYMFSDIVFAEQEFEEEGKRKELSYIFYFGDLNYNSFQMVKAAYSKTVNWDKSKEIILYVYNTNEEFRKIEPDIKERIFPGFNISIRKMQCINTIPNYIIND